MGDRAGCDIVEGSEPFAQTFEIARGADTGEDFALSYQHSAVTVTGLTASARGVASGQWTIDLVVRDVDRQMGVIAAGPTRARSSRSHARRWMAAMCHRPQALQNRRAEIFSRAAWPRKLHSSASVRRRSTAPVASCALRRSRRRWNVRSTLCSLRKRSYAPTAASKASVGSLTSSAALDQSGLRQTRPCRRHIVRCRSSSCS